MWKMLSLFLQSDTHTISGEFLSPEVTMLTVSVVQNLLLCTPMGMLCTDIHLIYF